MGMFRVKNPKETIFIACTGVLMFTLIILVSLVGKNLTYTTRFTPPSTQKSLKNESYFTESQVIIVALGAVLILVLPSLTYTVFLKSKRLFVPLWITFISIFVLVFLVSLYYLFGSQNYREYLSQVSSVIDNTPNYCETSLCNRATCARMSSFHSSRQMVIAFGVIGFICSVYIGGVGFIINLNRRKSNQIELIM